MSLSGFHAFQRRVRQLRQTLGWSGAFSAVAANNWSNRPQYKVNPSTLGRAIHLRPRTTDLLCYEKVFVAMEYELPFQMSPRIIVDAGANIGAATLFFHDRYPEAQIIAIEPESSNFSILTQNCRDISNVKLVNSALWSKNETLAAVDKKAENWAFRFETSVSRPGSRDTINALGVEDIMAAHGLAHIDILKLDIEGAEKELFQSGSEHWLGKVRVLIIELHDRFIPGCSKTFYRALSSFDFQQEIRGENIFINLNK